MDPMGYGIFTYIYHRSMIRSHTYQASIFQVMILFYDLCRLGKSIFQEVNLEVSIRFGAAKRVVWLLRFI